MTTTKLIEAAATIATMHNVFPFTSKTEVREYAADFINCPQPEIVALVVSYLKMKHPVCYTSIFGVVEHDTNGGFKFVGGLPN